MGEKYENVPLHKQDFVRFSDRFYWILKYLRDFLKLADVMSQFSNYFFCLKYQRRFSYPVDAITKLYATTLILQFYQ